MEQVGLICLHETESQSLRHLLLVERKVDCQVPSKETGGRAQICILDGGGERIF